MKISRLLHIRTLVPILREKENKIKVGGTMDNRVDRLELDMSDVKTRLAVAESNIKDVKEDISTIKDDTRWLRRTITSSIITVVIGAIVVIIKVSGGM